MTVSLVIPGRNAARTIEACLQAVVPLLDRDGLTEIIFVDDGSTDITSEIVRRFPVRYVRGTGRGPGAARNLGWQAARGELVWFIDADCVAEPDALAQLLTHFDDAQLGGISGSYGNMEEDSLLACLIHEEIIERHRSMPRRVNFLATFNVVYRRAVLEEVGGFDERLLKGQDAELSWRVLAAGYTLGFEINSRVKHFHPVSVGAYLHTQRLQGYWRAWLHTLHQGHSGGDSYSSLVDHVQPPLAMLAFAALPLAGFGATWWVPLVPTGLLAVAQVPMTTRLWRRKRQARYVCFAGMSFARAFWRGVGLTQGVLALVFAGRSERATRAGGPAADLSHSDEGKREP